MWVWNRISELFVLHCSKIHWSLLYFGSFTHNNFINSHVGYLENTVSPSYADLEMFTRFIICNKKIMFFRITVSLTRKVFKYRKAIELMGAGASFLKSQFSLESWVWPLAAHTISCFLFSEASAQHPGLHNQFVILSSEKWCPVKKGASWAHNSVVQVLFLKAAAFR